QPPGVSDSSTKSRSSSSWVVHIGSILPPPHTQPSNTSLALTAISNCSATQARCSLSVILLVSCAVETACEFVPHPESTATPPRNITIAIAPQLNLRIVLLPTHHSSLRDPFTIH